MNVTPEIAKSLLIKLVSPNFDGILDYRIKLEEMYTDVDIVFDEKKYDKLKKQYNDDIVFYNEIRRFVKNVLKLIGLKGIYTNIVINDKSV